MSNMCGTLTEPTDCHPTTAMLQLPVGQHILREDVPAVLHQAAGRDLSKDDIAALLRCFVLDSCATCSWPEFERSWQALQQLGTAQASGTSPSQSASTRRASAAVGPRAQTQAPVASQVWPASQTHNAESGCLHACFPTLLARFKHALLLLLCLTTRSPPQRSRRWAGTMQRRRWSAANEVRSRQHATCRSEAAM